jgi:signal transduction histidine kinase
MSIGNEIMQGFLNDDVDKFKILHIDNINDKYIHTLYIENIVYMIFKSKTGYIKLYIPLKKYEQNRKQILINLIFEYGLYFIILLIISILFALYAINPLTKALKLNEEFVKDMLHDFNTPLTSLNINYQILKKKFGDDDAIKRSQYAINSILSLQNNLYYFLNQSKLQNKTILLSEIITTKVNYFKQLFCQINFIVDIDNTKLTVNKDAFNRVIDNLINNACKYNKENGFVKISYKQNLLNIEDSGNGIKNPSMVFDRFYKESFVDGAGIGLHIVKKICFELKIDIDIRSSQKGTIFTLNLKNLTQGNK